MRKVLWAIAGIIFAVLFAQAAQQPSTREELLSLEKQWSEAYNKHNTEGVSRLLRDDFIFIDADAYVLTKRQYLDTIPRVQMKSETWKFPDVRVYGDTAIVYSIWNGTYAFDGKDTTESLRYMDIFIKENGKWQVVASQGTRIPKR